MTLDAQDYEKIGHLISELEKRLIKNIDDSLNRFQSYNDKEHSEIKEELKHFRSMGNDLYEKQRDMIDRHSDFRNEISNRVGKVEGRVKTLEDDKQDRKQSVTVTVSIIFGLIGFAVAVIGFIL